ncbi:microtubule integrity protein mal3 [Conglomerata obtusa]
MNSKRSLIAWFNTHCSIKIDKIEQLGTGIHYSFILYTLDPSYPIRHINTNAKTEPEYLRNLKHIQEYMEKSNVVVYLPIERMCRCKVQDNLEFAQWLYKFYCSRGGENLHKDTGKINYLANQITTTHSNERSELGMVIKAKKNDLSLENNVAKYRLDSNNNIKDNNPINDQQKITKNSTNIDNDIKNSIKLISNDSIGKKINADKYVNIKNTSGNIKTRDNTRNIQNADNYKNYDYYNKHDDIDKKNFLNRNEKRSLTSNNESLQTYKKEFGNKNIRDITNTINKHKGDITLNKNNNSPLNKNKNSNNINDKNKVERDNHDNNSSSSLFKDRFNSNTVRKNEYKSNKNISLTNSFENHNNKHVMIYMEKQNNYNNIKIKDNTLYNCKSSHNNIKDNNIYDDKNDPNTEDCEIIYKEEINKYKLQNIYSKKNNRIKNHTINPFNTNFNSNKNKEALNISNSMQIEESMLNSLINIEPKENLNKDVIFDKNKQINNINNKTNFVNTETFRHTNNENRIRSKEINKDSHLINAKQIINNNYDMSLPDNIDDEKGFIDNMLNLSISKTTKKLEKITDNNDGLKNESINSQNNLIMCEACEILKKDLKDFKSKEYYLEEKVKYYDKKMYLVEEMESKFEEGEKKIIEYEKTINKMKEEYFKKIEFLSDYIEKFQEERDFYFQKVKQVELEIVNGKIEEPLKNNILNILYRNK